MKNQNITRLFSETYSPMKALVIYRSSIGPDQKPYVESYDFDDNGFPINAHPLTLKESAALRKSLQTTESSKEKDFLSSKGIMPENILKINVSKEVVIWWTKPQQILLNFTENLSIPSGTATVPKMLWKVSRENLSVWALRGHPHRKPNENDKIYNAPFFNIYLDGSVCLGNIKIDMNRVTCLEELTAYWEKVFWNSNFSHLIIPGSPVKGNIVQLWKSLVNKNIPFPDRKLIYSNKLIKAII